MSTIRVILFLLFINLIFFFSCSKDESPIKPQDEKTKPSAPILISPSNNADSVSQNPMLVWHSSKWADSYSLQVSKNSSFTSDIIVSLSNLTDTIYTLSNLEVNAKYYWRVNALNDLGGSDWSLSYAFNVAVNYSPNKPILIYPSKGTTEIPTRLSLEWDCTHPSGDSLIYDIYLSKASSPSIYLLHYSFKQFPNEFTDSLLTKNWICLDNNTTYYWKIVAKDPDGDSSISEIGTFKTKLVSPWAEMSESPLTTYRAIPVLCNNKIYFFGSYNLAGKTRTVQVYDPIGNTWQQKSEYPSSVNHGMAICSDNQKIYIIGGINDFQDYLKQVLVYDPQTDTYDSLPSLNYERAYGTATYYNDKIFLMSGGLSSGGGTGMVEEFDFSTSTWTILPNQMPTLGGSFYIKYANKLFVTGNYANDNIKVFDYANKTWSLKSKSPYTIFGNGNVVDAINNQGILNPEYFAFLIFYDVLLDKWEISFSVVPKVIRQPGFTSVTFADRLYVFGGYDLEQSQYSKKAFRYNPFLE